MPLDITTDLSSALDILGSSNLVPALGVTALVSGVATFVPELFFCGGVFALFEP